MRKKIGLFIWIMATAMLLVSMTACSTKKVGTDTPQNTEVPQKTEDSADKKDDIKASEEPQATEGKTDGASSSLKQPILKNDTGKTLIQRVSTDKNMNTSFMITSKSGAVVVVDPYLMPADTIKPVDAICNTHTHYDHMDDVFNHEFKCKVSTAAVESFNVKDIAVKSIASSHTGDPIDANAPSNVIYVFDVDGLRIVHMGDIGQDTLPPEQLKLLGKVDVAFMQFENSYSDMSLDNKKGFKLMEQLKPQIIIPTHSSLDATNKIGEIVGRLETVENSISISKDDMKDGTRKVIDLQNTLY